jgi:hypothetical protein
MNEGRLTPGMVVRLSTGEIGYIADVSISSAHLEFVSRFEKPITTRKGVTKMVMARRDPINISPAACVEILDPDSRYVTRIREHKMSDQDQEVQGEGTEAAEASASTRAQQVYTRTSKKPEKEMRGQAAIVLAALDASGGGTLSEMTKLCAGKFQTRQSDDRIVGYYLSQFKKKGLVSIGTPVVAGTEAEAPREEQAAE